MKKYLLLFMLICLPILVVGLYGIWLIAPVGLLFRQASALTLSSEPFQKQLDALAAVAVTQKTGQTKEAATVPATITLTITAEELNGLISQGLNAKPSKLIAIVQTNVDISAETIYAVFQVRYGLAGLPMSDATVFSEWKVRSSAKAGTIEIKPIELHTNRLASVNLAEWWEWWQTRKKQAAAGGWIQLSLVIPLQIQDIVLEEDALALIIASK